ncbi:MAG: 4Fe-4S binding protein [Candidatus Heimdallarchaeaceae archaeon]
MRGGGRGRGGGFGLGTGGACICPVCGARASHTRGVPCFQSRCPQCGAPMTRAEVFAGPQPQNRKNVQINESKLITAAKPHIDQSRCKGCALCINSCPFNVIRMENSHAVIDSSACRGCGVCIASCPEGAIGY